MFTVGDVVRAKLDEEGKEYYTITNSKVKCTVIDTDKEFRERICVLPGGTFGVEYPKSAFWVDAENFKLEASVSLENK